MEAVWELVLHQNGLLKYAGKFCAKNRTKRAIGLAISPYMEMGVEPALSGSTRAGLPASQAGIRLAGKGGHISAT